MTYALDTNIVSYCLKGLYQLDARIDSVLAAGNYITIPPITFYESLRGLLAANATMKLHLFLELCRRLGQSEMERPDWEAAAKLYAVLKRKGQPIHDSDLLQAAFCLRNRYTLVTHNTRHFRHIDDLSVVDWVE